MFVAHRPSKPWYKDHSRSFFGDFYYRGDHSLEGYIPGRPMTVPQRTQREVDGIIRLLNPSPQETTILDAPCGYGRHLIEFRRRGYDISGIDLCDSYAKATSASLAATGLKAAVSVGELKTLPFPDAKFDIVLNLFFALGFYNRDSDNFRCMKEFARVLRSGGRLLFHTDVNMLAVYAQKYTCVSQRALESGGTLHIQEHFDKPRERILGTWTIVEPGATRAADNDSRDYSMRIYDQREFERMALDAGFAKCTTYGSFDVRGETLTEDSPEMIIVAEKA